MNVGDNSHPDVSFYLSYTNGIRKIHVHITTLGTPNFPHGLCLENTFSNQEDAVKFACLVQEYINKLKLT